MNQIENQNINKKICHSIQGSITAHRQADGTELSGGMCVLVEAEESKPRKQSLCVCVCVCVCARVRACAQIHMREMYKEVMGHTLPTKLCRLCDQH